jgi:ubiquinone/menaquinone biosynthesis C-methylase UbiE
MTIHDERTTAFRSPDEIRRAYRDEQVAREYISRRFRQPLGGLLHDRQVAAVRRVAASLGSARVLELAPGPARLTVDLAPVLPCGGTVMDASLQMLGEARRNMDEAGARSWRFVQGDAFRLPFGGPFDLVYAFRLIRHFDDADRLRIYAEVARVLAPGGAFVFDAVNERVSRPLRERNPEEYRHYDALLRPASIRAELARAGFDAVSLEGVQRRYRLLRRLQLSAASRFPAMTRALMEIADRTGGEPLEWIVTCRRA